MDNSDFIKTLSNRANIPEDKASLLLNGVVETIIELGKDMCDIAIPGFGTFSIVKNDERIVFDEQSNTNVLVPPEINIDFSTSVVMRKKILG